MVSLHLAFLHPSAAHTSVSTACGVVREDYSIGSLVLSETSFGLGVVSAVVNNATGWMVTLFEAAQSHTTSITAEWQLLGDTCWFGLEEEIGFNQSSVVTICSHFMHNMHNYVCDDTDVGCRRFPSTPGQVSAC